MLGYLAGDDELRKAVFRCQERPDMIRTSLADFDYLRRPTPLESLTHKPPVWHSLKSAKASWRTSSFMLTRFTGDEWVGVSLVQ